MNCEDMPRNLFVLGENDFLLSNIPEQLWGCKILNRMIETYCIYIVYADSISSRLSCNILRKALHVLITYFEFLCLSKVIMIPEGQYIV
jgi:hypothetical protein